MSSEMTVWRTETKTISNALRRLRCICYNIVHNHIYDLYTVNPEQLLSYV